MIKKIQKGFTLIELLVAAIIIALLATVGAISYTSVNRSSRDSRRKADLEQIRAALEMYRSNNNTYDATGTMAVQINNCAGGTIQDAGNTYLKPVPKDPLCTNRTYTANIAAADYTLGARLEAGGAACGGLLCSGADSCNYCIGPNGIK